MRWFRREKTRRVGSDVYVACLLAHQVLSTLGFVFDEMEFEWEGVTMIAEFERRRRRVNLRKVA